MISFTHPLLLLLLPPALVGFVALGASRLRRLPWLRALVAWTLRLALVILLIAALAGPSATRAAPGVNVVFVVDRSAGLSAAAQRQAAQWVARALEGMPAGDRASVVAFGTQASWSGPLTGRTLPPFPTVDGRNDNIAAGIRLALSTLPADQPSRLVLLSDGAQTTGDALQTAQQAALAQVPISVVPLSGAQTPDVAVTAVDLPASSRAGDHDTLRVTLYASQAEQVQLHLSIDGVPAGAQTLALPAGTTTYLFAQTIPLQTGIHRYRVQVTAPRDAVPQNDSMDAVTVVHAAPHVLLLAPTVSGAAPVAAVLQRAGLAVNVLPAGQAPTGAAVMAAYDAVVLDDVPASALQEAAIAALHSAVYDQGRGLLVLGGPHAFSSGGYQASPLESLLPVTSEAEAHAGRSGAALVLIIDQSGSMSETIQGVTKVSMAQQAVVDAVEHLRADDQFGVLSFNDTTHVVVPFGPVGGRNGLAQIRQEILALQPFGDTIMYPAMRQAARWLFSSPLAFKHVVLLTDGQGEPAAYLPLIQLMRRYGISLSTIGIGADAEVSELQSWATAGNGRFYYAANPREIPRLVVQETRLGSGPSVVSGKIGLHQATASPVLRSLLGRPLPPLASYNITAARPGAQVILQSGLGDPVLAQWQYGAGRVAVWTSGSTTTWAGTWPAQQNFWSDTVRSLIGGISGAALQPTLALDAGTLAIGADVQVPNAGFGNLLTTRAVVTQPGGHTITVPLLQEAPGRYGGTLPAGTPGVYGVQVVQSDGAATVRQATAAVVVPYPPVYQPHQTNSLVLQAIAAAGNAPALGRPIDAFSAAGLPQKRVAQDIWALPALIALLLFPLDVAVRLLYVPPPQSARESYSWQGSNRGSLS